MRPAPDWREFARYPVVTGTIVLATAVSIARWMGRDISLLEPDAHVHRGELWRLLTSAFPHVGIFHLVFNVYWTWAFGTLVESAFGSLRTAALFAFLAFVSSAAEYALFGGGVGLSGVGYGLFALLWVLSRRDRRFAASIDPSTITLFVVWFFFCVAMTMLDVMRIGNVAHAAGALAGAAVGAAISSVAWGRALAVGSLVLLATASVLGATVARPYVNLSPHRGLDEAHLGYEALQRRQDEDATRWLTDATRLDPRNAGAWFNLGIANQRLLRRREAAAAYEKAYRLHPDDARYRQAFEAVR